MTAGERAAALLSEHAHGRVAAGEPLGPLTTYRIGGPAAVFVEATSVTDLDAVALAARETGLPVLVVGRGSNVLVADAGVDAIVVRLGAGFRWARRAGDGIEAGSAMPLPALANLARAESLSGFAFAVAIPASLGGAVRMNAGAHDGSLSDVVEWATVYRISEGRSERLAAGDLGFAYRQSAIEPGSIVTAARLALSPGDEKAIAAAMKKARDWRRKTQPLNLPNAGSVFKNPPGDSAGRLVESVCGKGFSAGGARVSEVHANFIVTEPGATAGDVLSLIREIQRRVREDTGVELELEMQLVGAFEEESR